MKRKLLIALLAIACAALCLISAAEEDALVDRMEKPAPFGIAHAADGSGVPVYRSIGARNRADTLTDYQVCAILSTEKSGGSTWYRVRYLVGDTLKEGYIRDSFYQLTVAGLITASAEKQFQATVRALLGTAAPRELVGAAASPTATPKKKATATPTKKATATPGKKPTPTPASGRKRYALNTKTMKFHLPNCSEVSRITQENRKTTTTTRESLIGQGYEPCQRCDP